MDDTPRDPAPELAGSARAAAIASLAALIVLLVAMDVAMLAGIAPHPPGERGPFIAAAAAVCVGALAMFVQGGRGAAWPGAAAALAVLPAVGPHKLLTEPAAGLLSPVIGVGSVAALVLLVSCVRWHRARRA